MAFKALHASRRSSSNVAVFSLATSRSMVSADDGPDWEPAGSWYVDKMLRNRSMATSQLSRSPSSGYVRPDSSTPSIPQVPLQIPCCPSSTHTHSFPQMKINASHQGCGESRSDSNNCSKSAKSHRQLTRGVENHLTHGRAKNLKAVLKVKIFHHFYVTGIHIAVLLVDETPSRAPKRCD